MMLNAYAGTSKGLSMGDATRRLTELCDPFWICRPSSISTSLFRPGRLVFALSRRGLHFCVSLTIGPGWLRSNT